MREATMGNKADQVPAGEPAGAATAAPDGRRRARLAECLAVVLVGLLVVKLAYDRPASRDLPFTDEVGYMHRGCALDEHGLPNADYGPLYCVGYFLWSRVFANPIQIFDAHWLTLTLLLAYALYCLLRALRVPRAFSLLGVFLLLVSNFINVDPMSSHLATAVLAFGAAAALWCRNRFVSWAVVGAALAVTAYVRPEFAPLFVIVAALYLGIGLLAICRRPVGWRAFAGCVAAMAALVTSLQLWLGNPLGGGRGFDAFGQHYAVNVWQHKEQLNDDPWLLWQEYVRRDFSTAGTLREAAIANPHAFLWHLGQNLRNSLSTWEHVIKLKLDLRRSGHGWVPFGAFALTALAGGVGAWAARRKREQPVPLPWPLLAVLSAVATQVTVTCVLIYPAPHYFVAASFFAIALLAWGFSRAMARAAARIALPDGVTVLLAGTVLLAFLPNQSHGWNLQQLTGLRQEVSLPRPVRNTAAAIRGLPLTGRVTTFTRDGAFTRFAGISFQQVLARPIEQGDDFWSYVRSQQVSLVVFLPERERELFGTSPLHQRPADFALFPVQDPPYWIAVHREAIEESAVHSTVRTARVRDASSSDELNHRE